MLAVSLSPGRDTIYVAHHPPPCYPKPDTWDTRQYTLPRDRCRFTVHTTAAEPEPYIVVDCRRSPREL